jgi:hypothetical protein
MKSTPSVSGTFVGLRRRLSGALLVLGLTCGAMAMSAHPVEAAGAITTCFFRVGPNPHLVSSFPVELWGVNQYGVAQQVGASVLTDSQGCATFFILPQYQNWNLYTQIMRFSNNRTYWGTTRHTALMSGAFSYSGSSWSEAAGAWVYSGTWYATPGTEWWYLAGVLECQQSWPSLLTPC